MISLRSIVSAAALAALAAVPGQAATVLDNYSTFGSSFPTVQATNDAPVADGTSSLGVILGGERDLHVEVLQAKVNQYDNIFGSGKIQNGWFGPYNTTLMSWGIDQGAKVAFLATYDGVGVGDAAVGLNFDAAAAGSALRLTYMANLFMDSMTPGLDHDINGYSSTDIIMTLTDDAGRSASVTRRMPPAIYGGFNNLDFGLADFEAANSQLDVTSIHRIAYGATILNENFYSAWLSFMGAGFTGDAYSPVNEPQAAVPEPSSWAMMIAGIGLAGGMLRRAKTDRRKALAA